jgi:hypothetical protein
MSAAAFYFDQWDDLLDPTPPSFTDSAAAPSPSLSMMSSGVSTPSGEFQPFAMIGSAVSGGGGKEPFLCSRGCSSIHYAAWAPSVDRNSA